MKDLNYQMMPGFEGTPLKPVGYDKRGPLWSKKHLNAFAAKDALYGTNISRRFKKVATDLEAATQIFDDAESLLSKSIDRLVATENKVSAASKKVSGDVRKAVHDMAGGLSALEKVANFDRLEKLASTLERAANALTVISELEQQGRLEKIFAVVK